MLDCNRLLFQTRPFPYCLHLWSAGEKKTGKCYKILTSRDPKQHNKKNLLEIFADYYSQSTYTVDLENTCIPHTVQPAN